MIYSNLDDFFEIFPKTRKLEIFTHFARMYIVILMMRSNLRLRLTLGSGWGWAWAEVRFGLRLSLSWGWAWAEVGWLSLGGWASSGWVWVAGGSSVIIFRFTFPCRWDSLDLYWLSPTFFIESSGIGGDDIAFQISLWACVTKFCVIFWKFLKTGFKRC